MIWLTLLISSIVLPVYLVQIVFTWLEGFFTVIRILWNGILNVTGGFVAFTQQMNSLAQTLAKPQYGGLVRHFARTLFDSTYTKADADYTKNQTVALDLATRLFGTVLESTKGYADQNQTLATIANGIVDFRKDNVNPWFSYDNEL